VETTFVDGADAEAIAAAVIPGRTTVVLVESPSNPLLGVIDLAALGSITGPFTVVDATFATPLGQRTLDFGVDLVVHSATKGISGHNDVTLGVIAGERDLIEAVWAYSVLHGSVASPADAQAAVRGLRTLDVRLTRQSATSLGLARHLEEHPSVAAVHHLGLDSHPQAALVRSQMLSTGSMLSFEVADGLEAGRGAAGDVSRWHRDAALSSGIDDACVAVRGRSPGDRGDRRPAQGVGRPRGRRRPLGRSLAVALTVPVRHSTGSTRWCDR
jgi:cystathionine beta-lyase/cystathionine gamma-synthase